MELEQTIRQQITFLVSEIELRVQVEPEFDLTGLLAKLDDLNNQLEFVIAHRQMDDPPKLVRQTACLVE